MRFTSNQFQLVSGTWNSWGQWTGCMVCGEGDETRSRTCSKEPQCPGDDIETQSCMATSCPGKFNHFSIIFYCITVR